jgi:hypothetical protein
MSFYFPYNYNSAVSASILTSSLAQTATTSSFTSSFGVLAGTAFYSSVVGAIGPSGSRGDDATGCVGTVAGPSGSQGPSGSRGQANYDCPAGFIACPLLTPPTGYSVVCIPLPVPCNGTNIICPTTYTP